MKHWYAVHTHAKAETQAKFHLERQGFSTYLPRYLKSRRHAGKTDVVAAPLFPRYLFVEVDIEQASWRSIRSTVGVHSLVCQGERPLAVPAGLIEDIRSREDSRGMVLVGRLLRFARGDKVRIASGTAAEVEALFECAWDADRIVVLLQMLGRQLKVKVPLEMVSAYA